MLDYSTNLNEIIWFISSLWKMIYWKKVVNLLIRRFVLKNSLKMRSQKALMEITRKKVIVVIEIINMALKSKRKFTCLCIIN